MNNQGIATLTILLIIAGVIVIGGGAWYLAQEPEPTPVSNEITVKPDCLNYNVGDDYKGGKLAWCGEHNGEWKALIAAASDQAYDVEWGCYDTYSPKDFETRAELFTGSSNTYNILEDCDKRPIAASAATDYKGGGYTDWYLPSIDELKILYQNRKAIGGFATDQIHPVKGATAKYDYWSGNYWSSTEFDGNLVYDMHFYDISDNNLSGESANARFIGGRVRAVRSVVEEPEILPEEEVEITDWQTYRNKEYGFKIKYPQGWHNWNTYTAAYKEAGTITFSNLPEEELQIALETGEFDDLYVFNIQIIDEQIDKSLQEMESTLNFIGISVSKERISIGEYEGYKVSAAAEGDKLSFLKALADNGNTYSMEALFPEKCRIQECELFNQMISTFKKTEIDNDITTDWQTYRSEKYNYEIQYPEDWRIAYSIMEKKAQEDESIREEYRENYSIEDLVIITNLSIEEEQEYLEVCDGFYGGCYASVNFPAGTISLRPSFSANRDIEAEILKQELSGTDGFEFSNFRIEKTMSELEIRRWKHNWTMQGKEYEMASVSLPEKVLYPPLYYGQTDYQHLDEIIIRMQIGDNYEKDILVLDKILSTFKFIE